MSHVYLRPGQIGLRPTDGATPQEGSVMLLKRYTSAAGVTFGALSLALVMGFADNPCNGRVDVNCQDRGDNNINCTVYVEAARGCQIGS